MILKVLVSLIVFAGILFAQIDLKNTTWRLEELNHSGEGIPFYTLRFTLDTTAWAHMAINTAGYSYVAGPEEMKFKFLTMTCIVLSGRESEFLAAMDSVTQWRQSDRGFLFLLNDSDTLMRYRYVCVLPVSQGAGSGATPRPLYTVVTGDRTVRVQAPDETVTSLRLFTIQGACARRRDAVNGPAYLNTSGLSGGWYVIQAVFGNGGSATVPVRLGR